MKTLKGQLAAVAVNVKCWNGNSSDNIEYLLLSVDMMGMRTLERTIYVNWIVLMLDMLFNVGL